MNIEENITEFKKMIERDKDTLHYWKSDTFGHYEEPIKKLEKDILISETLLTAYEKEKEKNKKVRDMIEYYLIENNSLNDFDKRNKELRKLKKVLEE